MPLGGLKAVMVGGNIEGGVSSLPSRSLTTTEAGAIGVVSAAPLESETGAVLAVSVWIRGLLPAEDGVRFRIFTTIYQSLSLYLDTVSFGGTTALGSEVQIEEALTIADDDAFHHLYFILDTTQASDDDRVRIYIDGVLEAHTGAGNTYALNDELFQAIGDGQYSIEFGELETTPPYVYQYAIFKDTYPTVSEVYNSGTPVAVTGFAGLISQLTGQNDSPISDSVGTLTWTANESTITSPIIPS